MSRRAGNGRSLFSGRAARRRAAKRRSTIGSFAFSRRLRFEPLEDRRLLSITVNTLIDVNANDGLTTLREAIAAATPGETIDFSVTGTINLTQGQLNIDKNLVIDGPGANFLTIDAQLASRVFGIGAGSTNVDIGGLTLTRGQPQYGSGLDGGAVSTGAGLLSIHDSAITNSRAGGSLDNLTGGAGGGIWSSGDLSITRTTISGNLSGSGGFPFSGNGGPGGGISCSGALTITSSTISGNRSGSGSFGQYNGGNGGPGGGISCSGALTITSSTISGNRSGYGGYHEVFPGLPGDGGGVWFFGGNATVIDSTISGNATPGGSGAGIGKNGGTLTVTDSVIQNNICEPSNYGTPYGGGIANYDSDLIITGTTISGNQAAGGGGVWNFGGNATLIDSTISGNTGYQSGGGILNQGDLVITSSTISGNRNLFGAGGGITNLKVAVIRHSTITNNTAPVNMGSGVASHANSDTRTEVHSTTISGNAATDVDFIGGVVNSFQSNGFNLIGTGAALGAFNQTGDVTGIVNPLLGSLADNGGPTMTHALLAGSPAIDAGDPAAIAGASGVPLYDQRGFPYGRVKDGDGTGGMRIDVGAFELQSAVPALPGDYNRDGSVDAADYIVWRKTLGATGVPAYSGADGSGNGTVGPEDYGVWRAHFGETMGAGSVEQGARSEEQGVNQSQPVAHASQPPALPGVRVAARDPQAASFVVVDARINTPAKPAAAARSTVPRLRERVESWRAGGMMRWWRGWRCERKAAGAR